MGEHDLEHRDPGNTAPSHLTEDLDDDELAEILRRFEAGHGIAHTDPPEGWTGPVVSLSGGAP